MDRSDRKDVKGAAFDVVLRGYDKRQVDERLRFLGSALTAAENALRAATQRAAALEDALNQARYASGGEPPGHDEHMSQPNFGARVEKILKLAEEEAREVRNQADGAAVALLEQARTQAVEQRQRVEQEIAAWRTEADRQAAEQDSALQRRYAELDNARQELDRARQEVERETEAIRAQARADTDQIRTAVTREVDELFRTARAEAANVGNAARAEADQLLAQARAEADRLVASAADTAQQRKQSSSHELHQLSRLRDEINADLYRAKEVLDDLFRATGTGPVASPTPTILHKRRNDGAQPSHQARTV